MGSRSDFVKFLRPVLLFVGLGLYGCDAEDRTGLPAPSPSEVASYYEYGGDLTVEMSGNVAQVIAVIGREEYYQGGELWAKASPYIFLFSPATRQALNDHPGLGGVRVIVRYPDGTTLAEAMLERGTLTQATWTRALNIAGRARAEGSERPGYMRDLVRWGEDNTDFTYNPEYISWPP